MGVYGNRGKCVLKFNRTLYGIKKASANWFEILETGIERRSYNKSHVESCVFYIYDSVILTNIENCVISLHKQEIITSLIDFLKNGSEVYSLIDKGEISK